jgi:hypothetical protein
MTEPLFDCSDDEIGDAAFMKATCTVDSQDAWKSTWLVGFSRCWRASAWVRLPTGRHMCQNSWPHA